jgi:DnaJ family protein C protein 8
MADDLDIDAALLGLGKELDKDAEIERIRAVFSLDAYAVLDLQPGVPESDIKKVYRAKSLLIHPDKTKNELAPDAFDRLKKAQTVLLDEKLRAELDESIADARMLLMREKKLTADDEETRGPEFAKEWRQKTIWVIKDNEMRKMRQMKAAMREEGRAQKKEEEELVERKRKREHDDAWEKTRDTRINSWRDFQQGKKPDTAEGGAKKKKKKVKALG